MLRATSLTGYCRLFESTAMTSRRRGSAMAVKTSAGWARHIMVLNICLYRNMSSASFLKSRDAYPLREGGLTVSAIPPFG